MFNYTKCTTIGYLKEPLTIYYNFTLFVFSPKLTSEMGLPPMLGLFIWNRGRWLNALEAMKELVGAPPTNNNFP